MRIVDSVIFMILSVSHYEQFDSLVRPGFHSILKIGIIQVDYTQRRRYNLRNRRDSRHNAEKRRHYICHVLCGIHSLLRVALPAAASAGGDTNPGSTYISFEFG